MKSKPAARRAPERTCVVCRRKDAQRNLVRVALLDGAAVVDESGKGPGRGAYVCRRGECWTVPSRDTRLAHALKTRFTEEDKARLSSWAAAHEASWAGQHEAGAALPG